MPKMEEKIVDAYLKYPIWFESCWKPNKLTSPIIQGDQKLLVATGLSALSVFQ